jgi:hypothetical protein
MTDDPTLRGCILIFLSLFSFLAFLYFSYSTYMYCGFNPKNNPTVPGVIVNSAIEKSKIERRGYTINVTYEYHVDRHKYLSNRICCGESANESPEDIVQKYPIGSKVTVYYREKDHSLSVIDPRIGRSGPIMAYAFGFLFLWSLFISIAGPHDSGWIAIGMFGIFILSFSLLMFIFPPSNKDAAVNNYWVNIVMHFAIILAGLSCLFYSYLLKKKMA